MQLLLTSLARFKSAATETDKGYTMLAIVEDFHDLLQEIEGIDFGKQYLLKEEYGMEVQAGKNKGSRPGGRQIATRKPSLCASSS